MNKNERIAQVTRAFDKLAVLESSTTLDWGNPNAAILFSEIEHLAAEIVTLTAKLAACEVANQEVLAENARLREAAQFILSATPYPPDDAQVMVVSVRAIKELRRTLGGE